ncbi:hypothetical protein TNCV_3028391 [Trichonephila clavipes]|nr:hypothetical protein TNCV_3028391 [Trichonephila clavipes]
MFANKAREFLFTNNYRTRRPHRAQCLTVLQRNRSRSASLPTCFRTRTVFKHSEDSSGCATSLPRRHFFLPLEWQHGPSRFFVWSGRIRTSGWMFECLGKYCVHVLLFLSCQIMLRDYVNAMTSSTFGMCGRFQVLKAVPEIYVEE